MCINFLVKVQSYIETLANTLKADFHILRRLSKICQMPRLVVTVQNAIFVKTKVREFP